ncbi:Cyanidin 3-O-galactoside 2''-O-xylosyltransferase FGGT1 [Sesamum alatum]|uniref:Cyanidin 3-O-galactoside 2''-O-xylosyltransferase FGGT1 n=1 Tax=Sesamum alatum TaxID=300844 RepID=A0AAE2CW64_9LAMI|nr:Cyanidin 3-O-galactoside 2''-O-xylosyltransferase FGGT1 [Sesamum alatum]
MTVSDDTLTIFMYPWFGMGHLTPYLLTANKLATRGHKVFIVVPPKAQSKLHPLNLHPDLIHFIPISLPRVDGLRPDAQTTNDATIGETDLLLHALDLTQPAIESMLRDLKPHFVFFDFMHWLPALVRRLGLGTKTVYYSAVNPAAVGFLLAQGSSVEDLMNGPPGFPPSMKLYKHAALELKWFTTARESRSGMTRRQRVMNGMCESDAIGFKTCKETEGVYCQFLENKLKKPILLAGPMVPKLQSNSTLELEEKWATWLAKFKPKTVILCSFGSENFVEKDQYQQLLLGLELTGLPFVVAMKPPPGVDSIEEALPNGFKERIGERGFAYGGWIPQAQILNHPNVGCFVTHCGYGSSWEGLMSECQLVLLPVRGDPYVNAKWLSGDLGVGVEVEKGDEDGWFSKEAVCEAVMAAMGDESEVGKRVRAKHDEWRKLLFGQGFEDAYLDHFIHDLSALYAK